MTKKKAQNFWFRELLNTFPYFKDIYYDDFAYDRYYRTYRRFKNGLNKTDIWKSTAKSEHFEHYLALLYLTDQHEQLKKRNSTTGLQTEDEKPWFSQKASLFISHVLKRLNPDSKDKANYNFVIPTEDMTFFLTLFKETSMLTQKIPSPISSSQQPELQKLIADETAAPEKRFLRLIELIMED